jgi:hypothetical protein
MQLLRHSARTRGSTLVTTLLMALLVGIVLTTYITMVSGNQQAVARSEAWNASLTVAEAGVEEALAHLNRNFPTNLLASGWSLDASSLKRKRPFGDGQYDVDIALSSAPVVTSSGSYKLRGSSSTHLTRTVRVGTVWTNYVENAIATKLGIKLNGFTLSSDSFDSGDSTYSTPTGQYDPTKSKDGGDIATNLGIEGAFDAGNAKIKGKVSTGPSGTIDLGPGAVVGSDEWHDSGTIGLQDGWSSDDANVPMPPVLQPYTTGTSPSGGNSGGENYNYILASDNYILKSFGGKVLVTGDATLLVTDRVQFTGLDYIKIAPGGSLKLYVAAETATIGGNGVLNLAGVSTAFQYFGLPSNTSVSISGELTGFVYAPNADLTLNGGGNIYGATMSKSLTINGGYNFHFDEALGRVSSLQYLAVISWDEI